MLLKTIPARPDGYRDYLKIGQMGLWLCVCLFQIHLSLLSTSSAGKNDAFPINLDQKEKQMLLLKIFLFSFYS